MVMYKHALRDMCQKNGFVSFITTTSWMFLSSFEKLRDFVLAGYDFESLVDFGTELFEGKVGHNPIVAWVNRKSHTDHAMTGIRLVDYCYSRRDEKETEFFNKKNYHYPKQSNFSKIPGSPVAYWVSRQLFAIFQNCPSLESYAAPKQGLITGDNDRFLRYWHEVSLANTALERNSKMKWIPINKGGEFRRWYGNQDYVVNWENDGAEILNFKDENGKLRSRPQNLAYNFRASLSWSLVTSGGFSVRFFPDYFMFNVAGISCFPSAHLSYILGLLNTKITSNITQMLNPTINMNAGDVAKVPIVINNEKEAPVEFLVKAMISLSKADWDSYENSWDFKRNPLV